MSPKPSSGAEPAPAPAGQAGTSIDAQREKEMIGSLGEALAGVNLGANAVHNNAFSFHSEHQTGTPFNMPAQANNTVDSGWGFNADPNRVGPANSPEDPATPQRAQRKKSIDLFLSQSPSQMLGNDVFKLSTGNLPGLAMPQQEDGVSASGHYRQPLGQPHAAMSASPGNFGDARPNQGRTGSPSSAVTGTTTSSRSGSPYENGGSRNIQAYHPTGDAAANKRNNSFADEERAGSYGMTHGHGSHPAVSSLDNSNNQRLQSPYNNNSNNNNNVGNQNLSGFASPYDQGNAAQASPQAKQGNMTTPQQQPQQQVLYMAVPTPDGRGQVLQPVQMVQLPGKPFAYVLPGNGNMPAMQGAMQQGAMQGGGIQQGAMQGSGMQQGAMQSGGMQQGAMQGGGMAEGQQSMMVLPTMPVQQGQSSDLVGGAGGTSRNNNQNSGMGYGGADNNQYGDSPGLRKDDYSNMGQAGMGATNNQFSSNSAQPDAISSLYSTPQRPPLDALLGQVRRLSRDQVGCRLVQQALDEEGAMAATLILNEGLPFWGEAMVDPFGNYLFQKILEKITAEERVMLVKSVSTRLVNASLNLHGTRSVQKIVELCSMDQDKGEDKDESAADILTRSLAPAAARLCIDSHGNHVIQRILLKLGHKHSQFVFDAVAESVGDVARHRHGCCVIQRCLDSPPSPARSHLVRRIVDKALELMQDAYGNYVVQYVLDVCSDDDVHAVCEAVVGRVSLLAIQKFSSNVMEKCLERCTDRVKENYLKELSDSDRIRELMMDPFGNYVVQRALSVATHTQAVRLVESMRPHLLASQPGTPNGQRNGGVRNTAGGRRIMAKICRRFPNFTLNAGGTQEELYSQNKGRHHHHHQHPNPVMAPAYGQLPPGPLHHQQQYNGNPNTMNQLGVGAHQFDQRQPYYDYGDSGYFQQNAPHMGHGAYPSF